MTVFAGLWDRIMSGFTAAVPPVIPGWEIALIAAVAVGLSIPSVTWRWFGMFTTVVHELGHAFAAIMTFQFVTGISLHADHSGETRYYGRGWLRPLWAGFWGYPVPAVAGAALVVSGINGHGPGAMSVTVIVLALTLLMIRNFNGLVIIGSSLAVALALVLFVPPVFTGHVVIALGIALLIGAVRDLGKLVHVHFRRREELESSDAYNLFRGSFIPSPVWILAMAAVIALSVLQAWAAVEGR